MQLISAQPLMPVRPRSFLLEGQEAIVRHLCARATAHDPKAVKIVREIVATAHTTRESSVAGTSSRCGRGYSRRQMNRVLAAAGLPSPKRILCIARIGRVLRIMDDEALPLTRAARLAGFPDPFSCSNMVKRELGIRPREAVGMSREELDACAERALRRNGRRGEA